ncbi:MAG: GspE/PulE family protein, partial [Candidatus Bipolaricaulia bacterium]
TGSGKSTTLTASLSRLNTPGVNISTIEDPVEYKIEGVTQVQVNRKKDLTFANALRSFLRQDPDIVMVGEIRDEETAQMAMRAALTGHVVFSTLHTNSAAGAVSRMLDMGAEPYLLAAALRGIVAQRLVRKLCTYCKRAFKPTDNERTMFRKHLGTDEVEQIYAPVGCSRCRNTGYKGRLGVFELFVVDEELRDAITRRVTEGELFMLAREKGMITFFEDGLLKVVDGLTSLEELLKHQEH